MSATLWALLIAVSWQALAAEPEATQPGWRTIEVGTVGEVTIRFKHQLEITPADFESMAFEIERKGTNAPVTRRTLDPVPATKEDVPQDGAYHDPIVGQSFFKIEYALLNADGVPEVFNTLIGGDLWPKDAWPAGAQRLDPWWPVCDPTINLVDPWSFPPPEGVEIVGRLTAQLSYGKHEFETPAGGLSFTFRWRPPREVGFEKMRARLRQQFANLDNDQCHVFSQYTKVPQVAHALSAEGLLTALATGPASGRCELVKALARAHRDTFVRHTIDEIGQTAKNTSSDIACGGWDDRFLEPLVQLLSDGPQVARDRVLHVLNNYAGRWNDNLGVRRTVAASLIEASSKLTLPRADPTDATADEQCACDWLDLLGKLGATRACTAIPFLSQLLHQRAPVLTPNIVRWSARTFFLSAPLRLGDAAHDAIIQIIEPDPWEYIAQPFQRAGLGPWVWLQDETWVEQTAPILPLRDAMIAKLEARLHDELLASTDCQSDADP